MWSSSTPVIIYGSKKVLRSGKVKKIYSAIEYIKEPGNTYILKITFLFLLVIKTLF